MDCRLIEKDLFAYALGTSSDEDRDRTDEHLLGCTSCLRAYLRFKHLLDRGGDGGLERGLEQGAALGARPSDETRRRIRADVAALLRPRGAARVRQWLRRPIPLYQGLAVAAVATVIAMGLPQALATLARRPPETTARVDMSRPVPQALAVY
jgi:hypothetical protein